LSDTLTDRSGRERAIGRRVEEHAVDRAAHRGLGVAPLGYTTRPCDNCHTDAPRVLSTAVMDLPVVLRAGEDGFLVAECPAIPGCISQGKTREEALRNIREAIELCLENRSEEGWQLPDAIHPGS